MPFLISQVSGVTHPQLVRNRSQKYNIVIGKSFTLSKQALSQHQYGYDLGNERTALTNLFGDFRLYTYDNIGQLKTAQGFEKDGVTPRLHEQFGYSYDKAWNLNYRTNNAYLQTFNVNNLNELATVTNSGTFTVAGSATEPEGGYSSWGSPSGMTNVVVSGTGLSSGNANLYYDGTWARAGATLANGNNSYTATAKDTYGRSSSATSSSYVLSSNYFAYDLNGNLRTNNTRVFDYDGENQLIRIIEPGAWKSEFYYDGLLRRRIGREYTWNGSGWAQTNEIHYVYDGMLVVQERDVNNLPLVTYTRGNDLSKSLQGAGGIGGLLARTDNGQWLAGSAGAHAFYHCDGNGNVTLLVNTNGIILAKYEYDPYGNIIAMSGPLAGANTYRFSSKEVHPNSGLCYYGYRFYDPTAQRWLNRDPIEEDGGINLYSFDFNISTSFLDSYGTCGGVFGSPISLPSGSPSNPENLGSIRVNDSMIYSQLARVNDAYNTEDNVVSHYWNMQGSHYDTGFHRSTSAFTYHGNDFPGLNNRTMTGRDLNYIGVGLGFAAGGPPNSDAVTKWWYAHHHGNADPGNALAAMQAGYSAYVNKQAPCPNAFGTGVNSVAPIFP